jgi:acetyl esterase/lipase
MAGLMALTACGSMFIRGTTEISQVAYGPEPRQTLTMLYPRDSGVLRPAVLLIHGGGWVEGESSELNHSWAIPLANEGFVVANVEYRTGIHAPAPAAIRDVRMSAAWLCREAKNWSADVDRIAFVGTSAGGHLALMAALPPVDDVRLGPSCRPAAIVNLWGITDIEDVLRGPNSRSFTPRWIAPPDRRPEVLSYWSPLTWASASSPPVLTIHAIDDPVVPFAHARRLVEKLGSRGQLVSVDASWHAPADDDHRAAFAKAVAFLKRTLR